jgi:hypothetical protein
MEKHSLKPSRPGRSNPQTRFSHTPSRAMFHIEMFSAIFPTRLRVPRLRVGARVYGFGGCAVGGKIPFNRKYTACAP